MEKKILFAFTFIITIFGFFNNDNIYSQEKTEYIQSYVIPQTSAIFKINDIDLFYKMTSGSNDFYKAFDNNSAIQKYLIKFHYVNFILDYVQEIYFCFDSKYNPYSIMKIKDIENINHIVKSLTSERQEVVQYSGGGIVIKNKNYVDTSFFIYNDIIVFGNSETTIKIAKQQKKEVNKKILRIEKLETIFSNYKAWGIILNVKDLQPKSPILSGLKSSEIDSIVFVLNYINNTVRFTTLYRFTSDSILNTYFEEGIQYDTEDKIYEKHVKYRNYIDTFNLDSIKLNTYNIASGEGFVIDILTGTENPANIVIPFTQLFIPSISENTNYDNNIIEEIGTRVIIPKLPEKDIIWYDTGYVGLQQKNKEQYKSKIAKMRFSIQVDNYSIQLFEEVINNEEKIYNLAIKELKTLNIVELFADNVKTKNELIERLNDSVNELILSGEVELKIISIEISAN